MLRAESSNVDQSSVASAFVATTGFTFLLRGRFSRRFRLPLLGTLALTSLAEVGDREIAIRVIKLENKR